MTSGKKSAFSDITSVLFALLLGCFAQITIAADGPFEGLGDFTRPISTQNPEAQLWFDQGLAFMYAFNHDEAVRSFRRAAAADPAHPMAWWGVAIASGPHINNATLPESRNRVALDALREAERRIDAATPVERDLILALQTRYSASSSVSRADLDAAFAKAMAALAARYPADADVGAIYAESLAELRPWDLWKTDGSPQPGTDALIAELERVRVLTPRHPLANHLYIHALEASPDPARADPAVAILRDLQPGLGHMVHMPSHIDVRLGRWQEAIVSNTDAIGADDRYVARVPQQGFYQLYMAHNRHLLVFAAMMSGQSALALRRVKEMAAAVPDETYRNEGWADGLMAMPLEVQMRFGRWEEILSTPAFPDYVPLSRSLQHYARSVAFLSTGRIDDARREREAFTHARARLPEGAFFGNNASTDLLDVAERVMDGEIAFRSGEVDAGLALLAEAAAREDALRYDEPRDWIQPVRHPWGAALLQAGRGVEAEAVFRRDLEISPGNGWALYGLMRALQLQGRDAEAATVDARFESAWQRADIRIKSPCLCLPGV
jgi:tetratricopeptide (TPR) repeat protein